eukprot:5349-Hanusia_phi.AAC.5
MRRGEEGRAEKDTFCSRGCSSCLRWEGIRLDDGEQVWQRMQEGFQDLEPEEEEVGTRSKGSKTEKKGGTRLRTRDEKNLFERIDGIPKFFQEAVGL